jgi:hypothetical protein
MKKEIEKEIDLVRDVLSTFVAKKNKKTTVDFFSIFFNFVVLNFSKKSCPF